MAVVGNYSAAFITSLSVARLADCWTVYALFALPLKADKAAGAAAATASASYSSLYLSVQALSGTC